MFSARRLGVAQEGFVFPPPPLPVQSSSFANCMAPLTPQHQHYLADPRSSSRHLASTCHRKQRARELQASLLLGQ